MFPAGVALPATPISAKLLRGMPFAFAGERAALCHAWLHHLAVWRVALAALQADVTTDGLPCVTPGCTILQSGV